MKLFRKSVRDSLARRLLAIVERCIECRMYATSSNNVAEEMTNDATAILPADNRGDSVTFYGSPGDDEPSTSDAVTSISYSPTSTFLDMNVSSLKES